MKPKKFVHQSTDMQRIMEPAIHYVIPNQSGMMLAVMTSRLPCCSVMRTMPKISHVSRSVVLEQLGEHTEPQGNQ